uniref:Uncharacterized protein n=1 Tax=Avena sativa TaxID=4498 RepID=A0ACD5V8T5_AVESA
MRTHAGEAVPRDQGRRVRHEAGERRLCASWAAGASEICVLELVLPGPAGSIDPPGRYYRARLVIKADTIDAAVERILSELGTDNRRRSNRENVIYFDGWNGLGAFAVLQDVAKRLAVSSELSVGPAGLVFDEIIHIDCSKWESRRAMQRKIAEQLKLPDSVMEIFDKQDEEDDFDGLYQGSRTEIEQKKVLLSSNMDNRFNNDESRVTTFSSHPACSVGRMPYWISTTTCGFVLSPSGAIADNMFQHSHMLGVLKLSRCTFSFSSPPFLSCHSLRFLWLEHCQDLRRTTRATDLYHLDASKEEKELDNKTMMLWECFQSLLVLDVCYTYWDHILSAQVMDLMSQLRELNVMGAKNWNMSHLRGRLRNIRKLRVTKSTCFFNNDVFSEMETMELLDFSKNTIGQGMTSLSGPASNSSLKTVTIDGCQGLKIISFRGCKKLKNLFLKGSLESLEELDLSGTRVESPDLSEGEISIPKRIILLSCEKLRALLWPTYPLEKTWPDVLRIDTTATSGYPQGVEAVHSHPYVDRSFQQHKEEKFKDGWQISLTDTRLLRSLSPRLHRYTCMITRLSPESRLLPADQDGNM